MERADYPKLEGVYRILLLGDSYAEGLRVPLEQTFGKTLEAALNASAPAGQRFEVINAGISGWGTDQQLLWLRSEGAKYQPDVQPHRSQSWLVFPSSICCPSFGRPRPRHPSRYICASMVTGRQLARQRPTSCAPAGCSRNRYRTIDKLSCPPRNTPKGRYGQT